MKKELVDVLIKLYGQCPKCRNHFIGVGLDIIVEESSFFRSCSCGWTVQIEERVTPNKKQIPRTGVCKIIDCQKPIKARQLCDMHYARQRRGKIDVRPYTKKES